jgi:diaminohydroxyphosphoribosylaminopyrimidine deaminase/5-amino-6-(5-phosphoribosylamino)uracil reductase
MATTLTDKEAMSLAIKIAKQGVGRVSPNPFVGCVVLSKNGTLLSSGYHEIYGGPHAEINALNNLNEEALKEARVFITLEPCSHYGKTPPCAKRLAELPIQEVIYGLLDPNPLVSGKGIELLQCAGKKVTQFFGRNEELEELCEVFLLNQRKNQVFVSLKVATSLDGMMGLKSGESKWLTGEASRNHAHYLRATHDAVLVGVNTILLDNPSLNIRNPQFVNKTNIVVILDPNGKCISRLVNLNVTKTHTASELFIFTQEKSVIKSDYCQVFAAPLIDEKNFDLNFILQILWDKNIRSVLVEGGAYTLSEFLNQNKAHRLYQFLAPQLIGGNNGLNWSSQFTVNKLQDRITLTQIKISNFDQDLLISGLIQNPQIPKERFVAEESSSTSKPTLKFYRSQNGWIFGICEGLGESFDLPPLLIRFFWVLSFFLYGLGLGIYLALAVSLPRKDKIEKAFEKQFLGVCVLLSNKMSLEIGVIRFLTVLLALTTGGFAILAYIILYFSLEKNNC